MFDSDNSGSAALPEAVSAIRLFVHGTVQFIAISLSYYSD